VAVGSLWLYRPFPAACPNKLAATKTMRLPPLLWRDQTSPAGASSATAPRLPDADHSVKARGQAGDLPVPAQRVFVHARFYDHARSSGRSRYRGRPYCLPPVRQCRHPDRILSRLYGWPVRPLSTLRRRPHGRLRMTRGRCESLRHRSGLAPPTPCRSPGAPHSFFNRAANVLQLNCQFMSLRQNRYAPHCPPVKIGVAINTHSIYFGEKDVPNNIKSANALIATGKIKAI